MHRQRDGTAFIVNQTQIESEKSMFADAAYDTNTTSAAGLEAAST